MHSQASCIRMLRMLSSPRAADLSNLPMESTSGAEKMRFNDVCLQLLAARKTPLKEKQRVLLSGARHASHASILLKVLPEGLQEGNLWVLAQIVVQGTGATAVDARDLSSTRCSAQVCYIAEAPSTKSSGSSSGHPTLGAGGVPNIIGPELSRDLLPEHKLASFEHRVGWCLSSHSPLLPLTTSWETKKEPPPSRGSPSLIVVVFKPSKCPTN